MKSGSLLATLLAAAAFTLGCDKPATTPLAGQVREQPTALVPETQTYTYAQRAEYVATMQTELNKINRDLDQLAAKIEKSNAAAKAEASPKLVALRAQAASLTKQLDDARNASESTWDSVKLTSQKAYGELKDGFNQARQWVSEKIAP